MDLFLPDYGLTAWSLLITANLVLSAIAIYKLAYMPLNSTTKITWLMAILILPFVGSAVYFQFRKMKRAGRSKQAVKSSY